MNDRDLKIHLFFCTNACDQARLAERCAGLKVATLQMIGLPCSGKVNLPYLVKAFETGADAVLIVTCRQDECRNLEGALRAQRRGDAVDSLLGEIGLRPGRVAVVPAGDDLDEVCTQLKALCVRIGQDGRPAQVAPSPRTSKSAS
jgi:coenzyme F420-reducing hydrogenase delta subunit